MGRIYLRGKTWYIYTCYRGKIIRKAIGKDKKLANAVLKKKEIELIENKHLDIKKENKIKFSQLSKEFLEKYSKVNKRSWKRDQLSISHIEKFLGNKYIYEIKEKDIEEYKKTRLETGIKHSTLNRELACLKTILNKAKEWGYIDKIPKIKLFKENNQRVRYLTDDEEEKLLKIAPEPLKSIIIVGLNTGMRQGEILNLRWKDIDLKEGIIIIGDSKSKEKRIIPMNETLKNIFINLLTIGGKEYIFENRNGERYSGSYITHWFERIVKQASIKDFRFHDLRHTFASRLVMKGVSVKVVQELLGHKDYRMSLRYSHLSPEVKKQAVEILDKDKNLAQILHNEEIDKNEKLGKIIGNQRIGGVA
ncbi:MAG TPA: tyrosine-type recombinase/integrase [bacterium]|nr:tyrosine-type recombinase/integrase [bacterium]